MFFDGMRRAYAEADRTPPPLPSVPFSRQSRRHYNGMLLHTCSDLFPDIPVGAALFELGRRIYPDFAKTMLGKAIFSVAGKNFVKMVRLAPRAYSAVNERGTVNVHRADEGSVLVEFEDLWDFPPFTCGVWRGGMDVCSLAPTSFELQEHRPGFFDLHIQW